MISPLSNKNQCSTFTNKELQALRLLQTHLHHKPQALGLPADSTTRERINRLIDKEGEVYGPRLTGLQLTNLIGRLEDASRTITQWLWNNKAALYKEVYSVMNKNEKVLATGYYHEDEGFSILFLQSLRILYNYNPGYEVKTEPLSYLITTLRMRKRDLLNFEVPYSEDYLFTERDLDAIMAES